MPAVLIWALGAAGAVVLLKRPVRHHPSGSREIARIHRMLRHESMQPAGSGSHRGVSVDLNQRIRTALVQI